MTTCFPKPYLYIETPDTRTPERDYILSVLLGEFLGLEWHRVSSVRTDTRITLQDHEGEIILPDILLSMSKDRWLAPSSLPEQPLAVWDTSETGLPITLVDKYLPIIYGNQTLSPISQSSTINYSPLTINLPIDIFGSAFFMLTRYEEIAKPDRDEHDRFPAQASLAYQEGFLERPIVDEYVEVLWAAMKKLWPGLEKRKCSYKLVPTHDVDRPFGVKGESWLRVVRRFGGDLLRRKNPGMAIRRAGAVLLPGYTGERLDPNNTFDWIMDQSERHGLQSEFYFMAGKTSEYDSGYNVFAPRIQRLLKRIHERGHIIGFHPSYGTPGRSDLLASEAENLRRAMDKAGATQELRGGRQHYLRWQAKCTWTDWEQAGLKEDSSVGFAQHVGFRAGTCRRYKTWSWQHGRPLGLVERPLIAMEGSLLSEKYMDLNEKAAINLLKRLIHAVKVIRGEFTVLWHNDLIMDLKDLYEMIVSRTS